MLPKYFLFFYLHQQIFFENDRHNFARFTFKNTSIPILTKKNYPFDLYRIISGKKKVSAGFFYSQGIL